MDFELVYLQRSYVLMVLESLQYIWEAFSCSEAYLPNFNFLGLKGRLLLSFNAPSRSSVVS